MVRRGDPINDRQAKLLERIGSGDTLGRPDDASLRTTVLALHARGLVSVSKRSGVFSATVTDLGRQYLEHGQYTIAASASASATGATAKSKASPATSSSVDLLGKEAMEWIHVRLGGRKSAFPRQDLRRSLDENPAAIQVSDGQRQRAEAFLLELNARAAKHNQEVRIARRGDQAKLGYRIGTAQWDLVLSEDHLDSYGRLLKPWEIRDSYRKPAATGKLRLSISHRTDSFDQVWAEERGKRLGGLIQQIVRDVATGFDELRQRIEQEYRDWVARREELERKKATEQREWEAVVAAARPKAAAMLRRRTLVAALHAWRDADDLRKICTVLDDTAAEADSVGDVERAGNLRDWSAGGRALADRIDPTTGTASLGSIDFDVEPGHDDLRPYLNEWSPDGPHRDYQRKSFDELSLSRPWPPDWELRNLL